jgi:predicted nucleotide-binding protein
MDLLEEIIVKYETKGFEIIQKRKLKHGTRVFLKREAEGFLTSGFDGIYLYYYDGSATVDSIRECLKDYVEFYQDEDFGEGDKGFFLCSAVDEKLFRKMKRVKIEDDEIRNSIKPIVLKRTVEKITEEEEPKKANRNKRKVFVVHGRDKTPALELARFVEKRYPIDAIFLEEQAHRGRTLIEKLEDHSDVSFAFIILTPDDVGGLKGEPLHERGRQNVIFEWGQFMGKIGRKNVCLLIKGNVEIPSDLRGIGEYRFNRNIKECFIDVENELREAKLI